jgi:hypothetical protein
MLAYPLSFGLEQLCCSFVLGQRPRRPYLCNLLFAILTSVRKGAEYNEYHTAFFIEPSLPSGISSATILGIEYLTQRQYSEDISVASLGTSHTTPLQYIGHVHTCIEPLYNHTSSEGVLRKVKKP